MAKWASMTCYVAENVILAAYQVHRADTIVLLWVAMRFEDQALVDRYEAERSIEDTLVWKIYRGGKRYPDGDDQRAAALKTMALRVIDAGGWEAISVEAWRPWIGEMTPPELAELRVEVDMEAKTMKVRIDLRALIDEWVVGPLRLAGARRLAYDHRQNLLRPAGRRRKGFDGLRDASPGRPQGAGLR